MIHILLAIALILLIFWIVGLAVDLSSLIWIAFVIGLVLAIIWLARAVFWRRA